MPFHVVFVLMMPVAPPRISSRVKGCSYSYCENNKHYHKIITIIYHDSNGNDYIFITLIIVRMTVLINMFIRILV